MSDVFISYSRKDIGFAHLLYESLEQDNIDTWIDWERIPVGDDWWLNIRAAIDNTNVFIFLISRHSINSTVCKDEVDHALKNNKRIIPVVLDDLDSTVVGDFVPDLSKINWMILQKGKYFTVEETNEDGSIRPEDQQVAIAQLPQFDNALKKLNEAIHTDWEWLEYHKNLLIKAQEWQRIGFHPDFLIRGRELREFERVLTLFTNIDPRPTALMVSYIQASHEESERLLKSRSRWYEIRNENTRYAPDYELECARCDGTYTFTPSEHKPIPGKCPSCGFSTN
jgi:hypothetical protein